MIKKERFIIISNCKVVLEVFPGRILRIQRDFVVLQSY